ncbi:MAG TPA: glycosyltransferase family 39 protein [Candidatus Moranbacteria bacterium]|nr:glycosyltransferase family 39 protein [Candidatus Moranbacteria bacterium]
MDLTKKNAFTVLVAIILLGAFLRFYNIGATSFVADEFLDINSSYAYFKTGVWQNWDFNFSRVNSDNVFEARDSRAWIYKGQVAQVFKFLPPTESVARSVSAAWGVISIILIYLVAKYFTRKKEIGLISAFLFAVSVSGIIFDRKLRMYAMFFAVFLAFSWMLYRFLEEKYKGKNKLGVFFYQKLDINIIYLLPAIILGAVSFLTHQLTGNIVIIIFIYLLIRLIQTRKNLWPNKYLLGLSVFFAGYIVALLLFPDKLAVFSKGIRLFENHWSYLAVTFSDYSNFILAGIFLATGIYYLAKKEKLKKETLWLAVSFFAVLFSAILIWNRNVGDQYIFFIQSFMIIIVASGIYAVCSFFKENLSQFGRRAVYAPIIIIALILPNWGYFWTESNTYKQTSQSDNPNFRRVFTYFKKAKNSEDVLITRNFRNYYWSGAGVKVFDFGGELSTEKLKTEDIQKIQNENHSGWFIVTDNDESYVSNDAMEYAEKNFQRVSNPEVRGKIKVYRWPASETNL